MELLLKLLIAGATIGALDYIWLGLIAKNTYRQQMGKLLRDKPNMIPALAFYVIYTIGVVVFAVNPALVRNSLLQAAGYGALFGFVAYATYNLTSLSVIKGFTTRIAVIDLAWGAALTATASVVTYIVFNSLVV